LNIPERLSITKVLIAINVLVWLANIASGMAPLSPTPQDLYDWGASHVIANAEQPWRLLTSMFLHVGLLHLAVNMQALWVAGPIAESFYTKWPFLMLYLLAGLIGGLTAMVGAAPTTVLAGASGSIFGIMGAIAAAVVRHGNRLRAELVTGLKQMLWSFVAINMVIAFLVPGVSVAAHLGGLFGGFACGALMAPADAPPRVIFMRSLAVGVGATVLIWLSFRLLN
jgi:rhomboid protease GluP